MKLIIALSSLFCVSACASRADDTPSPDDPASEVDYGECDGDARSGCDEGKPVCCYALSIKHEYEMHEARKNGDAEAAQANEDAMIDLLETGCDHEHDPSCEMLDKLKTSS